MAGPLGRFFLSFSLLSSLLILVSGKPASRIIDDADRSDTALGYGLSFLPPKNGHWGSQAGCTVGSQFCVNIEPSRCQGGTWTATNTGFSDSGRSIEIDFFGNGISVYFTLIGSGPRNRATTCTFVLDGTSEEFQHVPREAPAAGDILYRQEVFSTRGSLLDHGRHKLVISVPAGSYLNFDYAEYSYDDDITVPSPFATSVTTVTVTSSSSPTSSGAAGTLPNATNKAGDGAMKAAIIGGSISGTIIVVAAVLFLIYRARRRRALQQQSDQFTFGVPSTYAGSTRKLSIPFWPNAPPGDNTSQLRNLTPLPEKRVSYDSYYPNEKYDDQYTISSPPPTRGRPRDRSSAISNGPLLSPANALMQSFYPGKNADRDKRSSATTGKLSRLEDNLSPVSNFPRNLQRFSEVRTHQRTESQGGVNTITSSNVLPLSPDSSAGRPAKGSYYAV